MGDTKREVNESPLTQGSDERIAYVIDFTRWGAPYDPLVSLYDETVAADVSAACLEGSPGVLFNEITTPLVCGLQPGHLYRLRCQVSIDGNLLSAFCRIMAERS